MTEKQTIMGPNGPQKTPGWHSWRHRTRDAQDAARVEYKATRGREARRFRAAMRFGELADLEPGQRGRVFRANKAAYDEAHA